MKVTAKALAPVALVAAFGFGTLAPHAQTPAQKVGFVDVSKVIAAHPNDKAIKDLQAKADAELKPIADQINAIDAKGAAATAAEKQQRTVLVQTYQTKQKSYTDQAQPKIDAVEKAADVAISAVAKSNGYSIVMDRGVAQRSGLVVFAEDNTDLTDAAVKAVKP